MIVVSFVNISSLVTLMLLLFLSYSLCNKLLSTCDGNLLSPRLLLQLWLNLRISLLLPLALFLLLLLIEID